MPPELCECCGQELPAPRPEDKWWTLLGAIVGGLLIADMFRGPRDA